MSGGSEGEKTEPPSPKKLRDARARGQVARSQEVVTTATLIAVVGYLWGTWRINLQSLMNLFDIVVAVDTGRFGAASSLALLATGKVILLILAPVLGVVILAATAANYLQVGSIFAFSNIAPKISKISPASGAKRIFSAKQLVETLKSIVKILFLSVLLYIVVRGSIGPLMDALPCGLGCISAITSEKLFQLLLYSALAFIVVSVVDFAYQRHTYTKSLMMTKDEVKREYKESEGDPHIKGKRKQLAQELIMSDDANATRKSTAVVVNPTHYAVALKYVEGETALPLVVAKGQDKKAHFLRAHAEEAGVPVFRNVALARLLYADVEVNAFVPDELLAAVAEVLVWVERHKHILYNGPFGSGVIDMDLGDHKSGPD